MTSEARRAEECRLHREAFALAQDLGCTPREAMVELRRRTRTRRNACGRFAGELPGHPASDFEPMDPAPEDFGAWGARWMMRD
jgi:hypothetical protein